MEPVELSAIVKHMGARWVGTAETPGVLRTLVAEVATDTRTLCGGAPVFVALKGENFDGHQFLREAKRRGAVAAVVAEESLSLVPAEAGPFLAVRDPLAAMERLAKWNRDRLDLSVVGVTGSVGKTSTKEFLATVLRERFQVTAAPKSFNNRIGVAATLLGANRNTEVIVSELGTSGPGELSHLSKLVRPDHVILTEIAPTHLAGLGDLDGVLAAKAEVFDGFRAGGNAYLREGIHGFEKLKRLIRGNVKTFGWNVADGGFADGTFARGADTDSQYTVTDCQFVSLGDPKSTNGSKAYGYHFTINGRENFLLPVPGRHNVLNAAAAIGVARDFGLSWQEIRSALAICRLPPLRLEVKQVKGVTFVNDCYNASPLSVEAAIDEWETLTQSTASDSAVAVLGDMLELGDKSRELHEDLGRRLSRSDLRLLVTVGSDSRWIGTAYGSLGGPAEKRHFDRVEDAIPFLRSAVVPGDSVLVKGSRKTKLELVCKDLHRWIKLFGTQLSGGQPGEVGGQKTTRQSGAFLSGMSLPKLAVGSLNRSEVS